MAQLLLLQCAVHVREQTGIMLHECQLLKLMIACVGLQTNWLYSFINAGVQVSTQPSLCLACFSSFTTFVPSKCSRLNAVPVKWLL